MKCGHLNADPGSLFLEEYLEAFVEKTGSWEIP